MVFGPGNPFYDAFETDPTGQRANFFGRLQSQKFKSPNQRKYFEGQFENVQNRYLGHLGNIVQGGGNPTTSLSDYLAGYFQKGGGADEDFSSATLGARRDAATRFAPPVRYLL